MSEDDLIQFGRYLSGDSPNFAAALEYAAANRQMLNDEFGGFGGVLNMVITSKAPSQTKLETLKKLIALGAKPEGPSVYNTTFWSAVSAQDVDLARFLAAIVPVAICEAAQHSPLALAIHNGNLEMVKLLVEAGMDPGKNHNGETMISRARKYGHKEIEEYLRSKCTPEQLAQVPAPGSFADVLATNFAQVTKTASHVLMGVSVHFGGNLLITEGLGCESPDGTSVEFFMARAEDAPEDWALSIVMAGVDGLRSGKAIASDIGEIVPMKGVPRCKYTHLLLLKDRQAGSYQFFRAFPIFKKEAKFAIKSGARALVARFQERGVPKDVSLDRRSVV